jgi:iron complex outermembrane receptor protein
MQMVKIYAPLFLLILTWVNTINAQITPAQQKDTSKQIQPVTVKAYLTEQPVLNVPASINVIGQQQLDLQPGNSFIPVLNSQPGVRAEERSPGSYRLSIRGSLLRSPFGVRDVKIYFDDIPLTDAGGNTYLTWRC